MLHYFQGNSGDSSDTSDDFNPRGANGALQGPNGALQTAPVIKPQDTAAPPAPLPARLAPPPTLAPRDPTKIAIKPLQGGPPAMAAPTNPFSAPPATAAPLYPALPRASDPFGMSSFAAGGAPKVFTICCTLLFQLSHGLHFRTPSPRILSALQTFLWTSWTP